MAPTYWFNIDWSNNGTWTNTGEDVTHRVLQEVNVTYGRDQTRALSPIANGSCAFELDNNSRDYSPENSSSPLNGLVLPARPMRIQVATQLLNGNTDFEADASGWTPFGSSTFTRSSLYAKNGSWSGRLVTDGGSDPRVEATAVTVSPSTSYQYAGYLFSPVALPTQVHVGVNWFTSGGSYISTSMTSVTLTANVWSGVVATATSPGTAGKAGIRFGFTGTPGASQILYGDDVRLTPPPYTLFRGHLDDFKVEPARGERKVSVTGTDALAKLTEARATTDLYASIRTGAAIGAILDAIGWPPGDRDLDTGASTLRWWVVDGEEAFSAIETILAAEGSPALLTVDGDNKIVFRDRHHRLIRSASTTSQATFRDTGSEPKFSAPLTYDQGWRDIVNDVQFTVDERAPEPDLVAVWTSDQVYSIATGVTLDITMATSDPFTGLITPVSGTDFQVRAGSASVVLSRTQGKSATISITATGATVVDSLQVRGYPVTVARSRVAASSDAASITAYGSKSGPDGAGEAAFEDAQQIAALAVAYRSTRLPIVSFDVVGSNDTRLTQCLDRDLSDRVTVVDAETGLNDAFFIEQIAHNITMAGQRHVTTYGCEKIPSGAGLDDASTMFIWDHATQGKFGTGRFAR